MPLKQQRARQMNFNAMMVNVLVPLRNVISKKIVPMALMKFLNSASI